MVCQGEHIAGLASQSAADFLQCFEINPYCLAFFQPPQSCVTYTGLFRQPVKGVLFPCK